MNLFIRTKKRDGSAIRFFFV